MGKEILAFGDIENEMTKFYHHKSPLFKKRCINSKSISI